MERQNSGAVSLELTPPETEKPERIRSRVYPLRHQNKTENLNI